MQTHKIHNFFIAVILINAVHILPRHHNFVGANLREIDGILNNFTLGIVNHPALLRSINNQLDFFFRVRIFVFIGLFNFHQFQNPQRHVVKTPNNRGADLVKRIKRNRYHQGIALSILNCHRLWYQLTQNHMQQSNKGKSNTEAQRMQQNSLSGKKVAEQIFQQTRNRRLTQPT